MLTAVKNQLRVCFLSLKYNLMREMVNKVTFLTNICFMLLNNATFLVQWIILLRLREDVGGYTMREIMLLWGLTAASFGLSHILFARVFSLSELIIKGKLDSFLVQPKNVLVSVLTSSTDISAIGDFLYGVVIVCICRPGVGEFFLFLLFAVTGAVIFTSFALLLGEPVLLVCADGYGAGSDGYEHNQLRHLPGRNFQWRYPVFAVFCHSCGYDSMAPGAYAGQL